MAPTAPQRARSNATRLLLSALLLPSLLSLRSLVCLFEPCSTTKPYLDHEELLRANNGSPCCSRYSCGSTVSCSPAWDPERLGPYRAHEDRYVLLFSALPRHGANVGTSLLRPNPTSQGLA